MNKGHRKILVIKLCCLGDVIFLTPALRALRSQKPEAHIALLVSSWVQDIARQIPFIDDVIVYDAPLRKRISIDSFLETFRLLKRLRERKYDTLLVGHRNKLFSLLGFLAGIPMRIGFTDRSSLWITDPVRFDPGEHEIKRYLRLTEVFGTRSSSRKTEIKPPVQEIERTNELLLQLEMTSEDSIIGIIAGGGQNPGTSMPIKRWDVKYYIELGKRILQTANSKILLLGNTDDRTVNAEIFTEFKNIKGRVFDLSGRTSLCTLPAILQRCRIVIGADTGPMHLAAAVGTATLFLFGPSDPRLVAPEAPNSLHLWKQIPCSPCYTPETVLQRKYFIGKQFVCWTKTHDCLKSLTVEEVFAAYSKLLNMASNGDY